MKTENGTGGRGVDFDVIWAQQPCPSAEMTKFTRTSYDSPQGAGCYMPAQCQCGVSCIGTAKSSTVGARAPWQAYIASAGRLRDCPRGSLASGGNGKTLRLAGSGMDRYRRRSVRRAPPLEHRRNGDRAWGCCRRGANHRRPTVKSVRITKPATQ